MLGWCWVVVGVVLGCWDGGGEGDRGGLAFSMKERMPEKLTSMPLTTYGSATSFCPLLASCSILYPGDGSLDIWVSTRVVGIKKRLNMKDGRTFKTRAKRSRQFPTAMSMVSPKIR